jgi:hypothetical protein
LNAERGMEAGSSVERQDKTWKSESREAQDVRERDVLNAERGMEAGSSVERQDKTWKSESREAQDVRERDILNAGQL